MLIAGNSAPESVPKAVSKVKSRRLSPQAVELIAARFKVLSEPARLRLIMALEHGERNVTQLVEKTGVAQANVSRHLQALARAGIVARRKEGNQAYYHIDDPTIFELCRHVCGSLARHFDQQARSAQLFA